MNFNYPAALIAIVLSALTGCDAKYDQRAIEKKAAEDGRHCERVRPERIAVEARNKTSVRYSYVLKVVVDGTATGYTCFKPNVTLLEALANRDLHQMRSGEEIPVTQEISLR